MILEELLQEEKEEGRAEGLAEGREEGILDAKREAVLELLEEFGEIPRKVQSHIEQMDDLEVLRILHKLAARADSVAAFEEASKAYFLL